jgi:hypothetical protein
MKRAVVSSSADNIYGFFTPILGRLWRDLIGYKPLFILFKDEDEWTRSPDTAFILKTLKDDGHEVIFINPVAGYRTSTVMQLSRVLAAAIPSVADDDYLLTSDADMLPLNRSYFHQQDPNYRFHIFSADAYADIAHGQHSPKYPMCYLGTEARYWKEIMGIKTQDIDVEAGRALQGRLDTWHNDEEYLVSCLWRHPFHAGRIEKTKDHYAIGSCELFMRGWDASGIAFKRLDRAAWSYENNQDAVDAHFFRPGYTERACLLKLISVFYPSSLEWVTNYIDTFAKLVGDGQKTH